MRKIERDYRRLCQVEGVDLLTVERRGRHIALRFENGVVIAPSTPSGSKCLVQVRSEIRRMHRA